MRTRVILFFVISTIIVLYSCGKESKKPEAILKVVVEDAEGYETGVPSASVRLYSHPNGSYIDVSDQTLDNPDSLTLEGFTVTDALGYARFQTEYECILSVEASYINEDKIELEGKTILIFTKDETFEKTLVIK